MYVAFVGIYRSALDAMLPCLYVAVALQCFARVLVSSLSMRLTCATLLRELDCKGGHHALHCMHWDALVDLSSE